jgi:uncharacterized protein YfaS (alpha-2-macroglobulin family)
LSIFSPYIVVAQKTTGKTQKNMNPVTLNGLQFRLSEGVEGAEKREVKPQIKTDNLSESETSSLLKRLPPIKEDKDDKKDFAKRAGTLPAPKTGKVVPVKFPATEQRNVATTENITRLEVLRFSPTEEVELAADLSVTFSQPMVAVTSQEESAKTVPVQVTPALPEGNWRWLGTKTLMFDTKKRFPMATKFDVRIPAGTKSATGATLQKDVTWSFTTPPPKVLQMIPQNQTTRRDALMFISFDQEINPEAVLKTISVVGNTGKKLPLKLATQEEIDKDSSISYYIKNTQPKRWIAFRALNSDGLAENALPSDSPITVTVEKGTPSAEGPITTPKPQAYSYRTFGAMKYISGWCSYQNNKNCRPNDPWYLQFTNSINPETFDKTAVKIEPAVENVQIYPSGNYIYITGLKKGKTTYKVTYDANKLKDEYGQTIENPNVTATFTTTQADKEMYSQGGSFVILDPTAKPAYSFYSTNHATAKVKIYQVEPTDWYGFQSYMRYQYYEEGKRPKMPGRLVSDETVTIQNKLDELVETRVDLAKALDDGFGNAIVVIEPTYKRDKYDNTKIVTWCQATQIGLDAFVDNEELVGFVTDLKTGKPLKDVDLSIYPNGKTPSGKQATEGNNKSWWEWLTSWGTSEDSIEKASENVEENGESSKTEVITEAEKSTTTDNGILRLPLPDAQSKQQNILIAKRGKDKAFMPEQSDYYWQDYGNWYKKGVSNYASWFVFDDRKMYRPKEEVSIKGYIRQITGGKLGDVGSFEIPANSNVSYTLTDSRGNKILDGTAPLNAFGAFDFKFKLTDTMNLGYSQLYITGLGYSTYHQIQVQEFRRPEFEVSAKVNSEAPHLVGGKADLSVEAKYFAGGGLANAEANWTVTSSPTNYTPPNRDDFTFGKWVPWWRSYGEDYYGRTTQTFKGVTDASGIHRLKIDFESVKPPRPYTISASASVQDVNRQTWSSSTSLLVHPSELYVGLKTNRTFVQKGENIEVETIVADIEGKLVANRDVTVKAVLKTWVYSNGWKEETVDEQTCNLKSSEKSEKCKFVAKQGGVYTITASVMDDRERPNESEFTVWVAGGKVPPKRTVEQEEVQIIPNKKDFKAGDVAEILVMSPFVGAEGVLTLRREGLVKTERFTMKDSTTTLKIPLDEKYLPNITAQVDLVGATSRTNDAGEVDEKLAKRPAFASGSINLQISTASRELKVTAEPRDKNIEPAGSTKIDVNVTTNNGEPVANTEVAVVVVDESVLALTGYRIGNPLNTFYTQRGSGVTDYHLRKDILLANSKDIKPQNKGATGGDGYAADAMVLSESKAVGRATANTAAPAPKPTMALKKDGAKREEAEKSFDDNDKNQPTQDDSAINLRTNFNALALFLPSVKTDSNGKATVDVKVPDNLTRYRIMAVAVDGGKRFGGGESTLTARQPLMVRPSAPRFMNFGDKIELPVVVQNQTDKEMSVNVAVRSTNATLTAGGGRKVVVPANDRVEVRFPVSADKAGTARFQIGVSSGNWKDAAEIELPVWTPATSEAFATYGTVDESGSVVQPVTTPGDVWSQFGGLEVTTSSTQLQELTDAFIYLSRYRFECSEQLSSRMISIAALQDVLKAFKAEEMPKEAELKKFMADDIQRLKGRQRGDGGFGLWKRDERYQFPFVTAHVVHALALAKAKGYDVPKEMIENAKPYLKNIESHYDSWYSPEVRWTISAYALYVRMKLGDKDVAKAKNLLKTATLQKLPFEAIGWIYPVLQNDANSTAELDSIRQFLNNHTTETAATAQFVTKYKDDAYVIMASDRRADGVLLEALISDQPNNDLIQKLVRGLLDHRVAGRWGNTQENVFILLALDKYFQTYEKVTPNFVSRIWLGNAYAGEQIFKGRSTDFNKIDIPMSYLTEQGGTSNLILDKQGDGRLYYRIGMKYAPKNLNLAPADYGFTVLRKYEAVDNADDVKQNADGTWTIKAGSRVRVRLTMVAPGRRYHVALVDSLPAGLEILNPELAVTESIPADTKQTNVLEYGSSSWGRGYWWWRMNWFEHQNFRDERAEAFTSLLWEGVYNYSFVTRATTPGEFVAPPAKAEEMYHPETFGRSGTDFVKVE